MQTPQKKKYVLIACEESQRECREFRTRGFVAFSCDIQKCAKDGNPSWHIKQDVTNILKGQLVFMTQDGVEHKVPSWDLIIAHPPCTYLCKISSRWIRRNANCTVKINGKDEHVNKERLMKMYAARSFFLKCLNASAKYVAVENPCPMAIAQLPRANAFACPSWFGSRYTKKTYYWLKGLPPLIATYINHNTTCLVKVTRGIYRSRTDPYLAEAIAKQWGDYIMLNQ